MTHLGPIGRLGRYTATHLEHIAAAGPELQMTQANPSYRFTSERPQRTSHKYGSHSVSVLALKPVAARRHISDPNLGGGARVAQATREREPQQQHDDRGGRTMTAVTNTIRNGVDTEQLFSTLDLIKDQPELAKFQFRATNRWIDGSHNRSTIKGFYAAGGEDTTRSEEFVIDAGEPAILLGSDTGANPAEHLLHALAACLTTSIVYVAAARKVELTSVESTLTGDMDVRGALGVDDEPRNGFEHISVAFRVTGNAPQEKLREVVERAQKRSAVYDMVTNGVPVAVRGDDRLRLACNPVAGAALRPREHDERKWRYHHADRTHSPYRSRSPPRRDSPRTSPLELAARAAEHDRDGSYPFEAIDALKAARYFAAPIPIDLGGLGVSSAHDLVVASSRLARGDASVAIGVNMHLVAVHNMERRRQVAVATGAERRARNFASSLQQIAHDGVVLAAAISERGQDLTRPGTVATRTESGWRIDGRKMFCTMSPAATDLYVAVGYADDEGVERYAYAMVPTDSRGVVVHDDWDALGMRASGSNSITLEGVELPESGVRGGFRAGDPRAVHGAQPDRRAVPRRGLARDRRVSRCQVARHGIAGRINGDARPRMQVADNTVDLAAARGVLSRAAALIDQHRADNPTSDGTAEELEALFAEAQAAKAFVNDAAARIVDRALALSGGAGYLNGSPLARAYRDVKAGSFMHPLGANRAYEHLAHVALGEETPLH